MPGNVAAREKQLHEVELLHVVYEDKCLPLDEVEFERDICHDGLLHCVARKVVVEVAFGGVDVAVVGASIAGSLLVIVFLHLFDFGNSDRFSDDLLDDPLFTDIDDELIEGEPLGDLRELVLAAINLDERAVVEESIADLLWVELVGVLELLNCVVGAEEDDGLALRRELKLGCGF